MSSIVQWRQKEVITEIRTEVRGNLELVGEIVKASARVNMLRIREPEFGAAYRKLLALYRLRAVVSEDENFIEVSIGLPKGGKGDRYGWYIEMGSRIAPAHPWLRPALMDNLKNIVQLFNTGAA